MSKRRRCNAPSVTFRAGGAQYRDLVDVLRARGCSADDARAADELLLQATTIGLQALRAQLAAQQDKRGDVQWVLVPQDVLELLARQAGSRAAATTGGCELGWLQTWATVVLQDMACVVGYSVAAGEIERLRALGTRCRAHLEAAGPLPDRHLHRPLGEEVSASELALLRSDLEHCRHRVPCVQCGRPVEHAREVYGAPTCYACLPPPEPLPVVGAVRDPGHVLTDGETNQWRKTTDPRCERCQHFRPVEKSLGGKCDLDESLWYWKPSDSCTRFTRHKKG